MSFLKILTLLAFLLFNPLVGCVQKKLLTANESPGWFQIAVLPDTQYYTAERHNGKFSMFEEQINWIKAHQQDERIVYVAHVGDISDHGEKYMLEWDRARQAMYRLEEPVAGLPDGIPYGVAVGNHDTSPNGKPKLLTEGYAKSFGRSHFLGRSYYGGAMGDSESNDNHFDLFQAGGQDFIVLYLTYNEPDKKETYDAVYAKETMEWAGEILTKYKDRKAIVVSHSLLKRPAKSTSNFIPGQTTEEPPQSKFTSQGQFIYDYVKHYPNVFMMLCGHVSGEGFRKETFNGHTIKVYLADYQARRNPPYGEDDRNGGNGMMRLMKIDPIKETLEVRTIGPRADGNHYWEEDVDSKFTHALFQ